jgi:hypothetical protein
MPVAVVAEVDMYFLLLVLLPHTLLGQLGLVGQVVVEQVAVVLPVVLSNLVRLLAGKPEHPAPVVVVEDQAEQDVSLK